MRLIKGVRGGRIGSWTCIMEQRDPTQDGPKICLAKTQGEIVLSNIEME